MPQLPFEIPKSLASYAEHFDEDPVKAITRLKNQLQKRGTDAVGYFLLAWFYHLEGMEEEAVEEALKAKIYAPGSPFFEKLHYYLSHPQTFEAWTPKASPHSQTKSSSPSEHGPVLNLDSLIEELSKVESKRIQPDAKELEKGKPKDTDSDNVDGIVSETLASIHEEQGKYEAAIHTYEQLRERNKEKKDYYDDQIARLEKEKKENDESPSDG